MDAASASAFVAQVCALERRTAGEVGGKGNGRGVDGGEGEGEGEGEVREGCCCCCWARDIERLFTGLERGGKS